MNRRYFSILCSVVLTACPGEEPEDAPDAGRTISDSGMNTVADAGQVGEQGVAELVAAMCTKQKTCCTMNEQPEAECVERGLRLYEPIFTLAGIEVDQAALARCITRITDMSCDEAANYAGKPPPALVCEKYYRGTLPIDAACGGATINERFFDDERCASGSCSAAKCAPKVPLNGDCTDAVCEDGLECHQQVCTQPQGLNGDCHIQGLCEAEYECFGEPMTCQVPTEIGPGEACNPGTRCSLGDYCFCEVDDLGCTWGSCGRRTHCLN